jgi:hypothetical protein
VVHLGNGHAVWVLARFGPVESDYMFHCHNTLHEDHDMMAAFRTGGLFVNQGDQGDGAFATPPGVQTNPPATWEGWVSPYPMRTSQNGNLTFYYGATTVRRGRGGVMMRMMRRRRRRTRRTRVVAVVVVMTMILTMMMKRWWG